MPQGKKYSKSLRKWVDIEREQVRDYDNFDADAGALLLSYWRWYPDKFLDLCEAENPDFDQELIQRVMLRAFCRYTEVFITGSRGTTKTHVSMLSRLIEGVLWPGIQMQYFGPSLKQTAKLASGTYKTLEKNYPGLTSLWELVSDSDEKFELRTKYGSVFSIINMRGQNCHSVLAEEVAQEEKGQAFDHEQFRAVVLPSVRSIRRINRERDRLFPQQQKHYITSAGRSQNASFDFRKSVMDDMADKQRLARHESAFAIDIPAEVSVLSGIRDYNWYLDMKRKLTPEEWLREMESVWTGTVENPVIRDSVLSESANNVIMEDRHGGDPDAIYILGYDVSYADGAKNAKCATCVLKLELQKGNFQRNYHKSLVYICDSPPPKNHIEQARELKRRWHRFCLETGQPTYIAIDSWQYGKSVVEDLHSDLGDGLPPLSCINHEFAEIELDGALPVIYAVKETGGMTGNHDSTFEMLRYCELEFEHGNVSTLVSNVYDGVECYKKYHKIKTEDLNAQIAIPYIKCREFRGQIGNLTKKVSGTGMKEQRVSNSIQRDMWSCFKYAMRLADILEQQNLITPERENLWQKEFAAGGVTENELAHAAARPRIEGRRGGNLIL